MITADTIRDDIIELGSDHLIRFGGKYVGGIRIQQDPVEFSELVMYMINYSEFKHPLRKHLQIGAAAGGSVFVLNKYLKFDNIVVIDDGKHPVAKLRPCILSGISYIDHIGDSQDTQTVEWLSSLGFRFDSIFIDADHSYEGVKRDTELYIPYLKLGGMVIYHDINSPGCGIKKYTDELINDSKFLIPWSADFVNPEKGLGLRVFNKRL